MIKAEWTNADALDLQPTCNQLATDCISRQAAIDNLERYMELFSWDDGDRERAILSRVIKELQSMPSAQPEITTEDIEEYCRKRCLIVITNELFHEMRARWSQSQPEIIRCKDCKYSDTFPEDADNDMPLKCLGIRYGGVYPDWFCEHAERRTDE